MSNFQGPQLIRTCYMPAWNCEKKEQNEKKITKNFCKCGWWKRGSASDSDGTGAVEL